MLREIKKAYKEKIKNEKREYKAEKLSLKAVYRSFCEAAENSYSEECKEYYLSRGLELPKNPPKRSRLEELGNSVTHCVGAVFAVVAIVLMLDKAFSSTELAAALIYSFGLFVMFTMSTLYHALPYGSAVKRLFRRFDYSSIYLLIGATFAPILLVYVGGVYGRIFFFLQWLVILAGIVLTAVYGPTRHRWLHVPMYVILGWSGLLLSPALFRDPPLFWYVVGGGAVYSLGLIPFALNFRASHFIWHFFVLAAAFLHWLGIYIYVF